MLLAAAALSIGIATLSLKFDVVWEVPSSSLMSGASLSVGIVLLVAGQRLLVATAKYQWGRPSGVRALSTASEFLGMLCVLNAFLWPWLRHEWGAHGSPLMTWTLFLVGTAMFVAGYWMLLITRSAAHLQQPRALAAGEPVGLALAVAVIVVALFALTDQYAVRSGDRDGENTQKGLWDSDIGVLLETSNKLSFPPDMVKVTPVASGTPSSPATYRYECLRVVEIRSNRWVLVPAKWTRNAGYAVIVTPDASNRITTTVHSNLGAQTGSGDNVQRFWPCPEVVATFTPPDLDGKTLTPGEVQHILTTGPFESEPAGDPVQNMGGDDSGGPPSNCVTAAQRKATSSLVPQYPSHTAAQEQSMSSITSGLHVWVDEAITTFATPSEAFAFVATTEATWRGCTGAVVDVARHGAIEPRRVGQLHPNGAVGIPWVQDAATDAASPFDCSQAMAAKSNIVIDVDVCGSEPAAAMRVAGAIRDKIPT